MVHNHRDPPPSHGRGGRIPVRTMASRRPGLRSGGVPPEPTVGEQTPLMTIRIPAGTDNRGIPPIAPDAAGGDPSEVCPPSYTERAEPGSIVVPKIEPSATEPGQHPEND
jgi:hypothetical protein